MPGVCIGWRGAEPGGTPGACGAARRGRFRRCTLLCPECQSAPQEGSPRA